MSTKGQTRTPQQRANIAAALTGRKHTEQARANMRAAQAIRKASGVKHAVSDETRAKQSLARLGMVFSDEHREHMSLAQHALSTKRELIRIQQQMILLGTVRLIERGHDIVEAKRLACLALNALPVDEARCIELP